MGAKLKECSEISGWLKKPISVTPIDRNSLKKLMLKISVGYDFTLARYAGEHECVLLYCLFTCSLRAETHLGTVGPDSKCPSQAFKCCSVISEAGASEIQKFKDLPCQNLTVSVEVPLK